MHQRVCFTNPISFFLLILFILGIALFSTNLKLISFLRKQHHIKASDDNVEDDLRVQKVTGLNQHIWKLTATSIDFLCNVPLFPKAPDKRLIIKRLNISSSIKEKYAERLFGFLHPSRSGRYKFSISSQEASELWLSLDDKPENAKLIAYAGEKLGGEKTNDTTNSEFLVSEEIELNSGKKYFIEALHIGQTAVRYVSVQWKPPGNFSTFISIEEEFLSPFFHNDFDLKNAFYDFEIPPVDSCVSSTKENPFLLEKHTLYSSHQIFAEVLPNCHLPNLGETLRLERKDIQLRHYDSIGRKFFKGILIYPYDLVNIVGESSHFVPSEECAWNHNNALKNDSVESIVKMLSNRTKEKSKLNLTLESIVNVEKSNYFNGSRFLIELDLSTPSNDTFHISEYIYHDNDNTICFLTPWKRHVTVTFVITAKNQGKWIHVFLDNIASMIERTQDKNIKAIIFDYESKDIDLQGAIAWRGLEDKVKFLRKKGRYSRRESFNFAVQQVTDPHSIVFLTDLHLTLGDGLVNNIRKHTIEGEFIYTPVIVRLWEDTTPHNRKPNRVDYGYYELYGYGLVGIYKSDWDRVGGFPEPYFGKERQFKWGGEDYEFMDSVFRQGLEYYRIKCPYVYHYYHDKEGIWDRDNKIDK